MMCKDCQQEERTGPLDAATCSPSSDTPESDRWMRGYDDTPMTLDAYATMQKIERSRNAFKEGHADAWRRYQELSADVHLALTSPALVKDQILKAALLAENVTGEPAAGSPTH